MRRSSIPLRSVCATLACVLLATAARGGSFAAFESGQVRPLALSPDGSHLFAVNTPDNRLEIFALDAQGIAHTGSVRVGLEPVAVAARDGGEVWVVNHLSDSISIVDARATPPRVVRTLLVGDEPRDIVFAGPARSRAFITTAHRGQNSPLDPQLTTAGVGRADVWVFDADALGDSLGGDPLSIVTLFSDTPRALAATADGTIVYAAAFLSGNRTGVVSQEAVCDGGSSAPSCEVDGVAMPGGLPAPNTNVAGVPQPETGLIVKLNPYTGAWEDELQRDWRGAMHFSLPDKDVFAIDAIATPPRETAAYSGVGTVIFNLAVNPVTGTVYASNTDARNEVRFAGAGALGASTVRGHLHESRITTVTPAAVHPIPLNPHIDYRINPSPADVRDRSLAIPTGMAVDAAGELLYVAAFGSSTIGVLHTADFEGGAYVPNLADHIPVSGGGPSGLVLDEARQRFFVLTRFDNAVAVIDLIDRREVAHVSLFNPEPARLVNGRRFLYDAAYTSGNGEGACASCHVFAHFDGLAWDLGDPSGSVRANPNVFAPVRMNPNVSPDLHPLKGPMTTQTLRGMANSGAMHWRGDRSGGFIDGGDPFDAGAAFLQFNEAFDSLLGRGTALRGEEIQALADFVLQIVPPPNPIRALDNSLTPAQRAHYDEFVKPENCQRCHVLDPAHGYFGTEGLVALNPNPGSQQFFKVPHLRGLYEKVGLFALPPGVPFGDHSFLGDQVRGFGILNDGSSGRLPPPTEEFLLVFDSNFAPIVGQQVTLTAENAAAVAGRIDLLNTRAGLGECDLIVTGVVAGEARGWYRTAAGAFQADRAAAPAVSDLELRGLATAEAPLTYTCVPPGSGVRIGVDRDADGVFDRDELDAGSDPADPESLPPPPSTPSSTPSSSPTPTLTPSSTLTPTPTPPSTPTATLAPLCIGDCNGDNEVTIDELLTGVNFALDGAAPTTCSALDRNGDDSITIDELLAAVNAALAGCGGS